MVMAHQTREFFITHVEEILDSFQTNFSLLFKQQDFEKLPKQIVTDIRLSFCEGVANAIRHACELKNKGRIKVVFLLFQAEFQIQIFDHGPGFELTAQKLEMTRSSGRGLYLMQQLMDQVIYQQSSDYNTLILKRSLYSFEQAQRDLDFIYDLSSQFLEVNSLQKLYKLLLEKIVNYFCVQRASILIYQSENERLKVAASVGLSKKEIEKIEIEPGQGVAGLVFSHLKPLLKNQAQKGALSFSRFKDQYKSQSFMSAPIIVRSKTETSVSSLGVINVTDRVDGNEFTDKDLKLLVTLANQVSAYVHLYGLVDSLRKSENLAHEMELAREIHSSYLPKKLNQLDGFYINGFCQTPQAVGGDYFDAFVKQDKLYLVLMDTAGHGIQSAMVMINIRSLIRALIDRYDDPAQILTQLNQMAFDDLSQHNQLVILSCFVLDKNKKSFAYSLAGSQPPLVYHPKGKVFSLLPPKLDPAIGLVAKHNFKSYFYSLESKEVVMAMTDGFLGFLEDQVQLVYLLLQNKNQKLDQLIHKILRPYLKNRFLEDDATFIGFEAQ